MTALWGHRIIILELAVLDVDDDRAFDGIAGAVEFHGTGDAVELLNLRQGVPHLLAVQGPGLGDGRAAAACRRHR